MADVVLIGNGSNTGYNIVKNTIYLQRFQAAKSGTLNSLAILAVSAGFDSCYLGIYSDNAGEPDTKLTAGGPFFINNVNFQQNAVSSISITKDTYYWLAADVDGNSVLRYSNGASTTRYKSYTFGALPDSAGSGYSSSTTINMSIAGYGAEAAAGGASVGLIGHGLCGNSPLIGQNLS